MKNLDDSNKALQEGIMKEWDTKRRKKAAESRRRRRNFKKNALIFGTFV